VRKETLKQLAALYPCPNAPLGYATMGLKTLKPKLKKTCLPVISTKERDLGGPRFAVAVCDYRADAQKRVPPKTLFTVTNDSAQRSRRAF